MKALAAAAVLVTAAGCGNDTDPRWQLRHDRIIAVRTTPSHVAAGQVATLDALITSIDGGLAVASPVQAASAATAPGLAAAVTADGRGGWQITAPDAGTLDAARAALGLASGAAVPLDLTLTLDVGGELLAATKRTWLGDARDNPGVGPVTVDGVAPGPAITIPFDTDVALAIDVDPSYPVNWLTSCGSLNSDDNEHAVLLHVERDDPTSGQLAVVVRDGSGGVAWQTWSIAAPAPDAR